LLRVQKCAIGRSQEVSSNVPARTARTAPGVAELALGAPQIHEPQSGQTHRVVTWPLSAVRWIERGSPFVRRKAISETTIAIEKALLVIRWQSVQWQA
jgi:hypothetical protein